MLRNEPNSMFLRLTKVLGAFARRCSGVKSSVKERRSVCLDSIVALRGGPAKGPPRPSRMDDWSRSMPRFVDGSDETMRVTAELSSLDEAAWPFSSMSGSDAAMVARLGRCVTLLVLLAVAEREEE